MKKLLIILSLLFTTSICWAAYQTDSLTLTGLKSKSIIATNSDGKLIEGSESDPLSLHLNQSSPQTIINGQPIWNTLTASSVVFTDALKKLTSTGMGTSGQFIKGDGSLDGGTYLTSVSVASSNGFTGSSSGGQTPSLTLATSITGVLKGNGTAISACSNLADVVYLTAEADTLATVTARGATTATATTFTGGLTVNTAGLTITDQNVALGTTTGTRIGTATNQKLSFFNSAPIVQVPNTTEASLVLSNLGLRAAGTQWAGQFDGSVGVGTAPTVPFHAKLTAAQLGGMFIDGTTVPQTTAGNYLGISNTHTINVPASGTSITTTMQNNTLIDNHVINGGFLGGENATGLNNDITMAGSHSGGMINLSDNMKGMANKSSRTGTITAGLPYTLNMYGAYNEGYNYLVYNNAAGTYTANIYGLYNKVTNNYSLTAGTMTSNTYGEYITMIAPGASGGSFGTMNNYLLYAAITQGSASATNWGIYLSSSVAFNNVFGSNANSAFGTATTPTAKVFIGAGTATANTAPIQLTSGPVETSARAGILEFLTDDLYFTITTGAARKHFIFDDGTLLVSGNLPYCGTNGRLLSSTNLTYSNTTGLSTSLQITSTLAGGTSPFAVTSTTVNTNLNADLLDGQHGSYYQPAATYPKIVASANLLAQTATVASVTAYTTPNDSTIHSFRIGAYTSITAISAGTLTITVTFTDENNTAQTITYFPMGLTTAGLTTTGFTAFAPINIRCKDNTAITLVATFVGVSTTYDVGGTIESLY